MASVSQFILISGLVFGLVSGLVPGLVYGFILGLELALVQALVKRLVMGLVLVFCLLLALVDSQLWSCVCSVMFSDSVLVLVSGMVWYGFGFRLGNRSGL